VDPPAGLEEPLGILSVPEWPDRHRAVNRIADDYSPWRLVHKQLLLHRFSLPAGAESLPEQGSLCALDAFLSTGRDG
jgi:hypothetical protein